jgi:hypothetical protein
MQDPISKLTKTKTDGGTTQVAGLPRKHKALSLIPSLAKKRKKEKRNVFFFCGAMAWIWFGVPRKAFCVGSLVLSVRLLRSGVEPLR